MTLRPLLGSYRFVLGALFLLLVLLAALAASLAAGDPFQTSETILGGPSWSHPLGTDELGRDVLTRILHGAATALQVALAAPLVAGAVGTVVGLAAGYFGGLLDDVLLKLMELTLVVPRFLIALVAGAFFGGHLWLIGAILAATFWPSTGRLVRAEAISLREREFVEASRSLGASDVWILSRHLLLLVAPVVAVNSSFQAGQAALIEAGLAFLGVGDRNVVSWGAMLADAQSYLGTAWWTSVFPGIALALLILALNLLGDGLADSWNVRTRTRV
ncbi:MAG: ABC transporter permease [Actinobacteria bacterium]|nr:ABC transporter permease [Actinomycetota bacterium]